MSLRKEIVELVTTSVANSNRADLFRQPLVGFSAADDAYYKQLKQIIGPEHLYPQDILPKAKTVVSFFVPFSEPVVLSNRGQETPSLAWAQGYIEANKLINQISEEIIDLLQAKGFGAATVKATHTYDESILKASWSHRSAAYIAGLGKFGVNRMLITRVGCAGRYGTVIIDQEIAPDARSEKEHCVYYEDGSCLDCIAACPVNALGVDSFQRFECHARLMENSQEFMGMGKCDVCGKCVVAGPCAIMNAGL